MTEYLHCHIRVKSHLSQLWADWFGGLVVQNLPNGEAVLFGDLPDYPALYGVVSRMRDLGIEIASVEVNGIPSQPALAAG
jgi:enamine deaminase RidA (YjgF/YER057c/UK114 family)